MGMFRYVIFILLLLVLAGPFALRHAAQQQAAQRQPAPVDGALTLIIMTPHQEAIRREFAWAFDQWHRRHYHTPVNIEYRSYGGGSDILRYFESAATTVYAKLGTFQVDLVWGGGDYLFDQQLKKLGYLEPANVPPQVLAAAFPSHDLAGLALIDPQENNRCWYGTALSSFGIVYNKDLLRYLHLPEPTTWSDLADPRYRGWILLADPTRSSSARQAFMVIVERAMVDAANRGADESSGWADGMGLIRLIASNSRAFVDSASAVPITISTGDAAAGMAIDFYARSQAQSVGDARMGYVEPANATIVNPDPIGLIKGAQHKQLAERFIEFVLSSDGQRLWNTRPGLPGGPRQSALRRLPIRPDVYPLFGKDFTDQVNPFTQNSGFNKSNAREKSYPFLGDLIEMSCMDPLDLLVTARTVLRSRGDGPQADMPLARFPFDQNEAMRRWAVYRSATVREKLRWRREWTAQFASEYRRIINPSEN